MKNIKYNYDLCVISFSDLKTDARSSNFIEFNRSNNLSVSTISISDKKVQYDSPNWICKIKPQTRFLFNYIKFIKFVFKIKKNIKSKVYYASDLSSLILANKIKSKDADVIYDSREIFSALGPLSRNAFKQKILTILEILSVRKIKDIVVSGEMDAKYLSEYFPTGHNYHIIKNLPNYRKIIKSDYFRQLYNIPNDKYILLYQGVLLEGRGIIPTLKFLKTTNKYVLVLIGDGLLKSEIKKIIKEDKLENKVYLHKQIPYNQLLNITSSADIGLSLIEPISFSYTLALPNKLFEYILAGLPVLVTNLPAMANFVDQNKVGEVVQTDLSAEQISNKLALIINNYNQYISNIDDIKMEYTYETQANIIKYLLKNIYNE